MIWHHQLQVDWDSHEKWTFWRCLCLSRHGFKTFRREAQNFFRYWRKCMQSVFPSDSNHALISTFLADMAFSDSWTDMVDFSWQRIFRTLSIRYGLPVWWMHKKIARGHISQHRNVCACVLRVCVIYYSLMNDDECTCLGHFFLSEGSANTCLGFFCTKDEKSSHWPLEDLALDIGIADLAFPWAVQFLRLVWVLKSQSAWRISPNRMLLILLLQGLHKILMLLHCCCNLLVLRFDLLPKKQVMWSTPSEPWSVIN